VGTAWEGLQVLVDVAGAAENSDATGAFRLLDQGSTSGFMGRG
jgi:hypothetical protein